MEDDYDLADTQSLYKYLADRQRNIDEWNEEITTHHGTITYLMHQIQMANESKQHNQQKVEQIMKELASRGEVLF